MLTSFLISLIWLMLHVISLLENLSEKWLHCLDCWTSYASYAMMHGLWLHCLRWTHLRSEQGMVQLCLELHKYRHIRQAKA